ncbi:family 20 glycosylhydrolase [Reichenbachiella agariperforans]|nr:family 20 glycosylhydrolase [Reichenbachiella agariperforans]
MRKMILILWMSVLYTGVWGQSVTNDTLAMPTLYGFAIAAPTPDRLDEFISFMEEELGPNGINTLVLRVDYNYSYESYPKLRNEDPLTKAQIKKLVKSAQSQNIALIPQINLLGHQSWASGLEKLLQEYPEFDETPHVKMPKKYEWPNKDSLYCKSYCTLHPQVHEVVFALVDEIMEVFEASAFHAGMDEVFYIGDDQCPRCGGQDKAELYAAEVGRIRDHLATSDRKLWIWGDRLLEGKTSGLGMWEGSYHSTEAAIDLIPKDVVICDWHYDVAEPTPALFATKGLSVISCFWNKAMVTTAHMEMMGFFQENSNPRMRPRYLGTMQTVWSPAGSFLDAYYGKSTNQSAMDQVASFKAMINYLDQNEK